MNVVDGHRTPGHDETDACVAVADVALRRDELLAAVELEMSDVLGSVDDAWMRQAIGYHLGLANATFQGFSVGEYSCGKKLRPSLAVLCYLAEGGDDVHDVVAFAAGLELLHNAALVHDDIEDRDRRRRGRPTLWTICGRAQAINIGDCMHALAFLAVHRRDPQVRESALALALMQTSISLTVGQRRDLSFEDAVDGDVARYIEVADGKTAALLRCSTRGGALLAAGGPGPETQARLSGFGEFGRQLGLAFQIRDDVLGIWGAGSHTGKPVHSDIRRRKKSLPIIFALQHASSRDRDRLRTCYAGGSELSAAQEHDVRRILQDCHAEEFAREQADSHQRLARSALDAAAGGIDAANANAAFACLGELTTFAVERTS